MGTGSKKQTTSTPKTYLPYGRLVGLVRERMLVGLVRKRMIAVGGMLLVLATLAFTRRAPTDLIPESSTIAGYAPVSPAFGYDPEYTSGLYGHDLTFYNFDPEAHPEQPLYEKALGLFLTHTTNHLVNPLWARASAESIFGTARERLRDMGWLPSPFRYQTDNWTYLAMHPPFPRPIDSANAAAGMVLYDRTCARCHGTVEPLDGAPVGPDKKLELVYDQDDGHVLLDEVETDPEYIKEYQHDRFIVENFSSASTRPT